MKNEVSSMNSNKVEDVAKSIKIFILTYGNQQAEYYLSFILHVLAISIYPKAYPASWSLF